MEMKSVVLVGLGPHARRIYFPLLQKHSQKSKLTISLLIDLKDQKDIIKGYLQGYELHVNDILLLDTKYRNSEFISEKARQRLEDLKKRGLVDKMIISTEPKAHKTYLQWAIDNDVDVLVDKPLTAPVDCSNSLAGARQIYTDFEHLQKSLKHSKSKVTLQVQRRYHPGYKAIRKYVENFIKKYQVPISYLDLYHADGMWNMPNEFFFRENHPYKYGYGKLMHSGYHFIDLLVFFLEAENNFLSMGKRIDNANMFVEIINPHDFFKQVDIKNYNSLFEKGTICPNLEKCLNSPRTRKLGEIDVHAIIQFKHRDKVITTASVNLLQNSFSRRAWTKLPKDTYKGNGRVRHERINLQLSHLLNVQMHSYQSHEVNKRSTVFCGEGSEHHFDISYYRNSDLVGGKPYEKIPYGELENLQHDGKQYLGHNEYAREKCFMDFINGKTPQSLFDNQQLTTLLLSKMYECIFMGKQGKPPYIEFKINNI